MFRIAAIVPADLIILAEYALHIAVIEENIAYPSEAGDDRFLSQVGKDGADAEPGAGLAVAQLIAAPIGVAIARAAIAIPQLIQRSEYFWRNR